MAESARQRRSTMARRKKRRIGAFSKRLTFSDLDRRTNAGKYVNSIKNDLEAQIGTPSAGQHILIKLFAVKMLRCEMMYERVVSQPMFKQFHDQRSANEVIDAYRPTSPSRKTRKPELVPTQTGLFR
jgi:hypothetical protein